MLYTIPDYYKEFKCTADRCEDTCCAGWQIVIDDKALNKYKKVRGKFMGKMFCSVNWKDGTFRQDKEKRCAFLNEENLCDLYINLGENSLCRTCKMYPRHIEEFEGSREITLSVSCPEVARILMERMIPVKFLEYEKESPDDAEEYDDFDPFLFSILQDARSEMIAILQNRELPLSVRVLLVLGMAHDMHGRINRQELFSCNEVIDKYTGEKAKTYVEEFLQKENVFEKEMILEKQLFEKLYDLEFLKEDWYVLLRETEMLLYGRSDKVISKEEYQVVCKEFREWADRQVNRDIHLEQLLVYFLFTYFPGAVYDGEIYAKVQMAVYCTWMIEKLWMARWICNEKSLELEEMTELVYRFSREVEHSDDNLKKVEKLMEKKWFLKSKLKRLNVK